MFLTNIGTLSIILPLLMGFFSFLIKDKYPKCVGFTYLSLLLLLFISIVYSVFGLNLLNDRQYHFVIGGWSKAMGIELKYNIHCALILASLSLIGIVFFATNFFDKINYRFRGFACIMLCGANGITITNDIFNSYVFFEIICITTYITYSYCNNGIGLKNAYNYIILSSFTGVIFLLVACFLYQITGNLNIDLMHNVIKTISTNKMVCFCFIFFVFSMVVKIGVYPFHGIMFGVYKNLSLKYLMLVAGVSSIVYPILIIKIVVSLFGSDVLSSNEYVCVFLKILGCLGFLFFNIVAFTCKSATHFVIALSFAQTSFFVCCIPYLYDKQIFNGVHFSLVSNAIIKVCCFGFLFKILDFLHREDINKKELSYILPLCDKVLFILLLFFVAGMPVSMVFMSKWYILYGIINSNNGIIWATLIILGFSIEIVASFAFIRDISLSEQNSEKKTILIMPKTHIVFLVSVLLVLFFLFSSSSFCGYF